MDDNAQRSGWNALEEFLRELAPRTRHSRIVPSGDSPRLAIVTEVSRRMFGV